MRRGGFPRAWLAGSERDSVAWRKQFIQTLLERDLPQWGVRVPAVALLRFWTMLARCHGQIWNAAEPARTLGVSPSTMRRYLDLLTDALVLRQLQPWHANLGKRQVKSPKIYVRDSGLLLRRGDRLLGVEVKRADAPRLTSSIRIAIEDLGLERVAVVYPGARRYPLGDRAEAVPLSALATPASLFGREPAAS